MISMTERKRKLDFLKSLKEGDLIQISFSESSYASICYPIFDIKDLFTPIADTSKKEILMVLDKAIIEKKRLKMLEADVTTDEFIIVCYSARLNTCGFIFFEIDDNIRRV